MGLAGKIDLLLEAEDEIAVVDFKLTSGEPGQNHRLQLAGYSLLAEAALGVPARRAFLYRIPDNRIFPEPVTAGIAEGGEDGGRGYPENGRHRSFARSRPRSVGDAWSASLQTIVRTSGEGNLADRGGFSQKANPRRIGAIGLS